MMSTQTYRAHCGACSGPMVLVTAAEGAWYVCMDCGCETEPRATVAAASEDVVWVPVRPAQRRPAGAQASAGPATA